MASSPFDQYAVRVRRGKREGERRAGERGQGGPPSPEAFDDYVGGVGITGVDVSGYAVFGNAGDSARSGGYGSRRQRATRADGVRGNRKTVGLGDQHGFRIAKDDDAVGRT